MHGGQKYVIHRDLWRNKRAISDNNSNCHNRGLVPESAWGFLAIYWLKTSFLSKVKGMGDRGILRAFHLCARVFEILVQTLIFKNCLNGGHCHNWRHVPLSMRFLAVYCFLSKVEGMDDRGIMRTFHICAWFCLNWDLNLLSQWRTCPPLSMRFLDF